MTADATTPTTSSATMTPSNTPSLAKEKIVDNDSASQRSASQKSSENDRSSGSGEEKKIEQEEEEVVYPTGPKLVLLALVMHNSIDLDQTGFG